MPYLLPTQLPEIALEILRSNKPESLEESTGESLCNLKKVGVIELFEGDKKNQISWPFQTQLHRVVQEKREGGREQMGRTG